MNPKKPRDKRELCYPFIFETSFKCDFEIATDELCCQVGAVLSHLAPDADTEPMLVDLAALQRLIYNLNGSVRGKLGIFDADLEWLKARYDHYNEASRGSVTGFVLPQGPQPIPTLHLCRCGSKKVVRLLVRLEESGVAFDPSWPTSSSCSPSTSSSAGRCRKCPTSASTTDGGRKSFCFS